MSQWKLKVKASKLPKARENAGDQVLIFFSLVIGWESGESFLDQSESEGNQKQLPRHLMENCPLGSSIVKSENLSEGV